MASGITTSLVIRFSGTSSAANAILTAEVDSRDDGLNSGKTSFIYGDSPAYLIFKTPNVTFTQESTAGTLVYEGTGLIDVDETLQFVASTDSSLSKVPVGAVTWTLVAGRDIDTSTLTVTGTTVTSPTSGLAVVRAQYQAQYLAYRLTGVTDPQIAGLEEYEVIIYILGTVT